MDRNLPTSSAVPSPEQIQPNPNRNGGLNDIEIGNTQQSVPILAGNPSQVLDEAPKTRCNGPCCIPLETACLLIGAVGIILVILEVLTFSFGAVGGYLPRLLELVFGLNLYIVMFYVFCVLFVIVNVLLIVGSKKKLFVLVIIYMIATGIYVLAFLIAFFKYYYQPGIYYFYLYTLLQIYFLVVAAFYCKDLKRATKIQPQCQNYMPQAQGQDLMTSGLSQANGPLGQVVGLPEQGQAVGSPGQGQQYGQSY